MSGERLAHSRFPSLNLWQSNTADAVITVGQKYCASCSCLSWLRITLNLTHYIQAWPLGQMGKSFCWWCYFSSNTVPCSTDLQGHPDSGIRRLVTFTACWLGGQDVITISRPLTESFADRCWSCWESSEASLLAKISKVEEHLSSADFSQFLANLIIMCIFQKHTKPYLQFGECCLHSYMVPIW